METLKIKHERFKPKTIIKFRFFLAFVIGIIVAYGIIYSLFMF